MSEVDDFLHFMYHLVEMNCQTISFDDLACDCTRRNDNSCFKCDSSRHWSNDCLFTNIVCSNDLLKKILDMRHEIALRAKDKKIKKLKDELKELKAKKGIVSEIIRMST